MIIIPAWPSVSNMRVVRPRSVFLRCSRIEDWRSGLLGSVLTYISDRNVVFACNNATQ